MFFKKKKRMVDIRELQKRGVVVIPKNDKIVPTNSDGFVELGASKNQFTTEEKSATSSTDTFGFLDSPTPTSKGQSHERLTDLDNKIYKLEQRLELLEKKLDINNSESNTGPMGW